MDLRNLTNKGNKLSVSLCTGKLPTMLPTDIKFATTLYSPEYMICCSTVFQLRTLTSLDCNAKRSGFEKRVFSIFIKFTKYHPDDDLNYAIKFTSNTLSIKDKCFTSDDGNWRLVKEVLLEHGSYIFDVAVQIYVVPSASSFSPLYEDTELLDFELGGEDGSVHFHKLVLAASSPVLRRMLGGTWRETTEGRVDLPGTSKKTLQDLKNYMYMHILPDEGIEQLLLLSLYYMIQDLEKICVIRLMENLTPENACYLFLFAGKHEVKRLLLAILQCMENRSVDIKEMRNHFLQEEKIANTANN